MHDDALSVIVCGSSAAMLMPAYLQSLSQEIDLCLRVLLTKSAERFLSPQVAAWLADEAYTSDDPALRPIELARRSFAIVVLPATANTLAAAALGLAATPAQTALLASEQPALFFPMMNACLLDKNSTQRHIATLRADGHTVIDPEEGRMYELSSRQVVTGPVLLQPGPLTEVVAKWLEARLAGDGQDQA
ncbi:MAG TPA: flavoprotein [Streptosporangiaceae bacterium]|jgi:phosphopantothenoylcysteine synthetase/decarboxylase